MRESLTLAPRVGPFILCHSSVACVCARFVYSAYMRGHDTYMCHAVCMYSKRRALWKYSPSMPCKATLDSRCVCMIVHERSGH